MGSRTWFKIFADKWLGGSLRQETPAFRGMWADLLALATSGRYGDDGIVQLSPKVGFKDEQIAGILEITETEWVATKSRLLETERISINEHGCIAITNWRRYQSDYERQKVKRISTHDTKFTKKFTQKFKEKEKEKEKEIENILSLVEYEGDKKILAVLLSLPGNWGKTPEDVVTEYNKFAEGIGKDMPFKARLNEAESFRIWWQDKNLKRGWVAWRNWVGKKLR